MSEEFIPTPTNDTSDEQLQQFITDANDLDFLIRQRGWDIILEDFSERKKNATEELISQTPGNEKSILAAHAVAHAVVHTCDDVLYRVHRMIDEGESARQELQIREDQKRLFEDQQQSFI